MVVPVGAVWMESYHSRLHLDFIAADLVVDLLTKDLSKGFVDQGHSMSGELRLISYISFIWNTSR